MPLENNRNTPGSAPQGRGPYSPTRLAGDGSKTPPPTRSSGTAPSNRPSSGARPSSSRPASDRPSADSRPSVSRLDPPGSPPKTPRRRRRRRMGPLGALLYVILVIGISALLAGAGWIAACDVLALNKAPSTAVVVIAEADKIGDVADSLKEAGLVQYKTLFKLFASVTHASDDITPGTYELNSDMDYRAIIKSISKNSVNRASATVTITEGMTLKQIFALLEEKGIAKADELTEVAASHEFKYSFLQELPLGDANRLEGYLFPDTYEFYISGDPLQIINKMLLRFDEKFTQEMRDDAVSMGYTIHEIVNIAAMIEKETDGDDQAQIAEVIFNRLNRPNSETAGYLNIDATIAYVTGQIVTDTSYPTPYNTHINKGLPPGPIANPGMTSIYAALHPDADYRKFYYYALGDDGVHHFFKTLKEQKKFTATQELYQK